MPENTFTGFPDWYGGSTGSIREVLDQARRDNTIPYEEYRGERIAPFTQLQQQAFALAPQLAQTSPEYGQARGAINGAIGQDIYGQQVQPYVQRGTTAPGAADINQYLNPYREEVLQNIGRLGSRNLLENILPNIQNRFIGAGQYGSSQHQNLTNRAIRDTQEGVSQAQANALHGGFNTALEAAQGQRARELQGAQVAGRGAEAQAQRQLLGAEALQNVAGAEQNQRIRGLGVVSQLGGQQQQQEQNASNVAYQNFQNQRNYPFFQTARLNEVVRGLPVQSQQFTSNVAPTAPQMPQASPYTQAGGLVGGLAGAYNQRQGFAHGGAVKKLTHHRHMADGGQLSPIQRGSNAAIDTAELKSMRDQATSLSRPNVDPFWAAISRAGFNVAANREPGVLAKLGEAGNAGLSEYHSHLANQDKRGLRSAKILDMIETTKRLQEQRNIENQLNREKFAEKNKQFAQTHAIHAGQLGLQREKLEHEKKLYEEGKKGSKEKNIYTKANEKELEQTQKSARGIPKLRANIMELMEVAKRLDTGPYKSKLPTTTYDIPIVGPAIAMGKPEDIDTFNSITNELGLDLAEQLKGSQIALGTRRIVGKTKPELEKVQAANVENLEHQLRQVDLIDEKNNFMTDVLNAGGNAIDVHKAFNKYAKDKLEAEDKGESFTKSPQDYLMEGEKHSEIEAPKGLKGLEEMSEAEIDAELEKTKDAA